MKTQNNPVSSKTHRESEHISSPLSTSILRASLLFPPPACLQLFWGMPHFHFNLLHDIEHGCHKLTPSPKRRQQLNEARRAWKSDYCVDKRPSQSICIRVWRDIYFCVFFSWIERRERRRHEKQWSVHVSCHTSSRSACEDQAWKTHSGALPKRKGR